MANQVLGQIARAFSCRDKIHFIKLYRVYVLCHLEYAVQSWSPYLQQDINILEAVQQRAVRMISGMTGTYEEKLCQVGLTTLGERRTRGDPIHQLKIINQIDDLQVSTFFQFAGAHHTHEIRLVGLNDAPISNLNLAKPVQTARTLDLRKYFFSHRVVDPWNDLPTEVKCAASVNNFKNLYDNYKTT